MTDGASDAGAPRTPRRRLERVRLDRLLVERGLAETRQKAQALIMAGDVRVGGKAGVKPGTLVDVEEPLQVIKSASQYVGRGGLKLEAALAHFHCDVRSAVVLDIGSSTGGFADCLLQHGAARVIAVDVGTGQLDWRLRQDPRVKSLERVNARYLSWEQIGEMADLITMDVSFISATRILPSLVQFCRPGTRLMILVKPQFEVGKGQVGKGGIVRDPGKQLEAVEKVRSCAQSLGFTDFEQMACPVLGAEGNQEHFLNAKFVAASTQAESLRCLLAP